MAKTWSLCLGLLIRGRHRDSTKAFRTITFNHTNIIIMFYYQLFLSSTPRQLRARLCAWTLSDSDAQWHGVTRKYKYLLNTIVYNIVCVGTTERVSRRKTEKIINMISMINDAYIYIYIYNIYRDDIYIIYHCALYTRRTTEPPA